LERGYIQKLLIPFRMSSEGWLLLALCILFGIALMGWRPGAVEGVLVIVCLLLHEVGHMVTAVALGVPVREFGVCGRGAYNRRAHSGRRRTEILISFSGPMMNLCLVYPSHFLPIIGNQLALYNLILCIVNLLPIPASDGQRILRNLLGSTADRSTRSSLEAPLGEARATLPAAME
jgi:membrane-associated protease RseP (regulator of RpoE activity)